jgi:hypothetical protein
MLSPVQIIMTHPLHIFSCFKFVYSITSIRGQNVDITYFYFQDIEKGKLS